MTNEPPIFILTLEYKLETAEMLMMHIIQATQESYTRTLGLNVHRLITEVLREIKEQK